MQQPPTNGVSLRGDASDSPGRRATRLGQVRLVSLDIGNTLVTSSEPGLVTLISRAAKPGATLNEAITLLHTRSTTQHLVDEICSQLAIQSINLALYRPPEPVTISGVIEGLARLRTLNVRLVSLSNVASVDAVPLPAAVNDYLDAHYQSFRIGAAKPDPVAFRSMLQAESADPSACVHIGDSWRCDAEGALSAGMSAFWLQPSASGFVAPSHEGLFVINSFNDAVETLVRSMTDD